MFKDIGKKESSTTVPDHYISFLFIFWIFTFFGFQKIQNFNIASEHYVPKGSLQNLMSRINI
jgi:hypothetical protein